MGKNKVIFIPQFNLTYIEGQMPVYLQVYQNDDGGLDIGFVVAKDEEEALRTGLVNGEILINQRLTTMFSRLAMFLEVDKKLKDS